MLCLGFLTSLTCGSVPCSHFLLSWIHTGLVFGPGMRKEEWEGDKWYPILSYSLILAISKPSRLPTHILLVWLWVPTFSRPKGHASVSCLLHKRATTASSPGGEVSDSPWSPPTDSSSKMKGATECQTHVGDRVAVSSKINAWEMLKEIPTMYRDSQLLLSGLTTLGWKIISK